MPSQRILILGHTGKLGHALIKVLSKHHRVTGLNSTNFDARQLDLLKQTIASHAPDIVINSVAKVGIDPCELDPQDAFKLNTLLPKELARLSNECNYRLIHFSTDSVFDNRKEGAYVESDPARPLNVYGATKYAGDCQIMAHASNYLILRIGVLFGPCAPDKPQFVEKMLALVNAGKTIRVSNDVLSTPCFSLDIAGKVARMISCETHSGLYHVANHGVASLYDLMLRILTILNLEQCIQAGSHEEFPAVGIKNTHTAIISERIDALRAWQDAVDEYCKML